MKLSLKVFAAMLSVVGAGLVLAKLFGVVDSQSATGIGMMSIGVSQMIMGAITHREKNKTGRLIMICGIVILVSVLPMLFALYK